MCCKWLVHRLVQIHIVCEDWMCAGDPVQDCHAVVLIASLQRRNK